MVTEKNKCPNEYKTKRNREIELLDVSIVDGGTFSSLEGLSASLSVCLIVKAKVLIYGSVDAPGL